MLFSQNWTSFEGNSCSDVYVDTCIITCGDTGEQNVPTLSICQTECELDELCNSWTYDTNQILRLAMFTTFFIYEILTKS